MEAKEFYQLAVKLIQDIKTAEPQFVSGTDAQFCMIVTAKKQAVYAGVTSIKVHQGKIMHSCPEYNAISAMTPFGETLIEKMITISFDTMEICQPCEECLNFLYQTNPNNKSTKIFVAPDKAVNASELLPPEESKKEENNGFAVSTPDAAPPPTAMKQAPKNPLASASDFGDFSDFSGEDGFGFEAAEPEEEPEEEEEQQPVQAQAQPTTPNSENAPQAMAQPYPQQPYGGYPQPNPYGGYPQQQPYGYPQQGGYMQPQSMYIQPNQPQSMYIQPNQPQSMYMQPNQPQSMYIQPNQQSMYIQPNQQSMYMPSGMSSHSQQVSAYQQPNYYAQAGAAPPKAASSTFRNRLANFMDDSDDIPKNAPSAASPQDVRKAADAAKEKKKMAKLEATFKRKK